MIISMIAAMDENRLIGADNALPWHLPADFRHFKQVTMAKPIIMGRKTFESIGRPLPGRKNIVLTRGEFSHEGVVPVSTIDEALREASQDTEADEVMIIGGANLYQQMIGKADKLYLTHVKTACDGDAWFPEVDMCEWEVVSQQSVLADENNNYDFDIVEYQRRVSV
ncbi:MAG TPA: type 3 dihydrofolate reductase [Gammaproteobacteria bacterium]